ncbi:MAG TPA: prolipoprotein diacylglyceryl transferase family protein, partial [Candidatus Limnocylindrales bacterium]
LWIARRYGRRMRPGDLFLIFLIWYSAVRFALETLRVGNWTFFGIPTAMVVSAVLIVGSLVLLAIRHRPGAVFETWGDPPPPEEELLEGEEWIEDDEDDEADDLDEDADDDDDPDEGDGDDEGTDDGSGRDAGPGGGGAA